ncbi:MAG: hypothetical protein WCC69_09640 [Pirellulales bacterium]
MNRGILLVAHGKTSYWDEATTLARSLRRHSPQLTIAVASDLDVPEAQWRRDGYDIYVPFDFRECGGVSFKMQLDRITPFADATLFIDSDSICYRDISAVFDAFAGDDFVTLGTVVTSCHWFKDNSLIHREFHCDSFPFFCGDFYLFRTSIKAAAVFDTARERARRYRALGIIPLGGWCNDEPAFSLAMLEHNVPISSGVGDWIIQVAHEKVTDIDLDYAAGRARAVLDGVGITPRLVHFSTHRSQPLYFRERYRVRNPANNWWNRVAAQGVGSLESTRYRLTRRLRAATARS